MRPINLIPERERRATSGSGRTGPLAYIVVGCLAVLLIGVVTLVLTSNEIADREDEIASLQVERDAVIAEANALTPYVNFEQVAVQRIAAVTDLADARFDWARVIRQLSLVQPPSTYLTELTASAGGGLSTESNAIIGPSIGMDGCAPGQDQVAGFVAALKQIDGVTRVGLADSRFAGDDGSGSSEGGEKTCPAVEFKLTVAFDEAPASPDAGGATIEAPPTEEEGSNGETPEGEEAAEGEAEGQVEGEAASAIVEPGEEG